MSDALLEAYGFTSLSELYRNASIVVFRGKHRETKDDVILKTRFLTSTVLATTIEEEYELLKRLYSYGVTGEPLAWFKSEGLDTLVMREKPAERFISGSEYMRLHSDRLELDDFFPLASASHFRDILSSIPGAHAAL